MRHAVAALPAITGKLELEYEGELVGGASIARELIRRAADATLKAAMSELLQHDAGWVAVLEPRTDRYLGVLTPSSLHAALRHSVDAEG